MQHNYFNLAGVEDHGTDTILDHVLRINACAPVLA